MLAAAEPALEQLEDRLAQFFEGRALHTGVAHHPDRAEQRNEARSHRGVAAGKFARRLAIAQYAFPNPVQADYDGPIAIRGLARDANVKVTDVAGNLVYEGKSLGGQAVWDARDYLGRRVASGVYLIYATSQATFDAPDAIITKVIILN